MIALFTLSLPMLQLFQLILRGGGHKGSKPQAKK